MEKNTPQAKAKEFFPYFIIIGAFCFLLAQTWLKWGSLIVDTGRELWMPRELLKGKVLYKDIVFIYGFLPPYLIAGLYKVCGISINVLVYTGIVTTLITSFTIYRISRFFLGQGLSTLIVLNFLFVFAFAGYCIYGIFNFILPYTFAATFFMAFTALALYFFLKFIFFGNNKNLIAWSLFLTAAFLCRPESSLIIWPAFLISGIILIRKQPNNTSKLIAYIFSPLLLAALSYGLFFLMTHTFYDFMEAFIGSLKTMSGTPMTLRFAGLSNIASNLSGMSLSFILHIAIILGIAASCRIAKRSTTIPILLAFILFILLKQTFAYKFQYNCLTMVLLCGSAAYFSSALHKTATNRTIALLALFLVSLLATYRIFFATTPWEYGFVLLPLPLICYYIFFCDILRTTLEQRLKISTISLQTAIAVLLIFMIIPFWEYSSSDYRSYRKLVTTTKGDFYCPDNTQTDIFWKTIKYLKKSTPENSTVAVFPEGVGINFFSDRDTPLKYSDYFESNIKLFGEAKMISQIKAAKIDYIAILTRDTGDFGGSSFGVDYALKIRKWIDANYTPVKQFGAMPYTSDKFGILILKKKS